MNLNRREFMRVTGLAGVLAALGIEPPEEKSASDFSGTRLIIPADEPVVEEPFTVEWWPSPPQLPLVDLSNLRMVEITVSRPATWLAYIETGPPTSLGFGSIVWEISAQGWESDFNDAGLSIRDLGDLLGQEKLYRFYAPRAPYQGGYWECRGYLTNLLCIEDKVAIDIKGTSPYPRY